MKQYRKKGTQGMVPWTDDLDMSGVSVAACDDTEVGGMVAVNKDNPEDRWYVAKEFFETNYEEA